MEELDSRESPEVVEQIENEWLEGIESFATEVMQEEEKEKEKAKGEVAKDEQKPEFLSYQELFSISNETVEKFYEIGLNLFEHEKYQDAADVFFLLNTLDGRRYNVWIAQGLAEKNLESWESAVEAFSRAHVFNKEAPGPLLHSAECYLALGRKSDAKECIENVLEVVKDKHDEVATFIRDSANELKSKCG